MDAKSSKIEIFRLKCDILKQIVNYLRSTIGLFVKVSYKTHNVIFYLPYNPNAFLPDYGMVFMDDPQLFTDPVVKVFENLLIVGDGNQFIMLDKPCENIYKDDLKPLLEENYKLADKELTLNKFEDIDRIKTIQKISLGPKTLILNNFVVSFISQTSALSESVPIRKSSTYSAKTATTLPSRARMKMQPSSLIFTKPRDCWSFVNAYLLSMSLQLVYSTVHLELLLP